MMDAILLAAGLSKRMGSQKLLLPFGGMTVVETVLDNLCKAGFDNIYAVFSDEVANAVGALPQKAAMRINPAPERGQSSSLAIALEMLSAGRDFCIMLGDLPLVTPDDIAALTDSFVRLPAGKTVFTPCRDGAFGHPMFYRSVWRERFQGAAGDVGGRKILLEYEEEIVRADAPESCFFDMDTPEQYRKCLDKK